MSEYVSMRLCMIDQIWSREPSTPNKNAALIAQLADALTDRAPLDPPPDDAPDEPAPPAALALAVAGEFVTLPDGVADGNLLMTLHDAEALVVAEFGVYGR
jgi:hypothetical protein